MRTSESAKVMGDRAYLYETLERAKVMGDRAYLYETLKRAKVMTRATGLSL
jgi:hypothetical protein